MLRARRVSIRVCFIVGVSNLPRRTCLVELASSREVATFVALAIAPAAQDPVVAAMTPPRPAITIEFSGGVHVKIEGAPDAGTLASVIGALSNGERRR
jgi:hypothetical protein